MVSVAEKDQRPDIPQDPEKLPGGTFEGWESYVALIQHCWRPKPGERPTFEAIIYNLRELLTESASQTRQRRLTDPVNSGAAGISEELRNRSGVIAYPSDPAPLALPSLNSPPQSFHRTSNRHNHFSFTSESLRRVLGDCCHMALRWCAGASALRAKVARKPRAMRCLSLCQILSVCKALREA